MNWRIMQRTMHRLGNSFLWIQFILFLYSCIISLFPFWLLGLQNNLILIGLIIGLNDGFQRFTKAFILVNWHLLLIMLRATVNTISDDSVLSYMKLNTLLYLAILFDFILFCVILIYNIFLIFGILMQTIVLDSSFFKL